MTAAAPKPTVKSSLKSPWEGFSGALWQREINVRAFIQLNYTPYEGDETFLAAATARTKRIWETLTKLFVEERKKGVLDISQIPSSITAHAPGYIDKNNEVIVGLQTEAPLKRAIMPNGGFRMVLSALKVYGHEPDPHVVEAFTKYRKTHNEGVFDAYTADIRRCRSSHVLTGLPDAYGRGRIIGDYRRVALYGVDRLIEHKQQEKLALDAEPSTEEIIRDREELSEQIRALEELKKMAASYEYDISGPARTAREAVQWLYFGYLAAVKEQNGAAMSFGPLLDFPRHLLRTGPQGGPTDRGAGSGDHRRLRHQAPDRAIPPDPGVRRALRRRSHLGDGVHRRDGGRRPVVGHQDQLPDASDPLQPGAGAGAQPDHLVLRTTPRRLPAVRGEGGDRHQLAAVRERRDHAANVGRRWRRRLLRVTDAGRKADAVLRSASQPCQVPTLRHQRRPRRDQRQAGRAGVGTGRGRVSRPRRRGYPVREDDGLARGRLRQCHERHPLHARQVCLRADRDGTARPCAAPHDGVRDGRPFGRRRQFVRDQAREGQGGTRQDGTSDRLSDRGRIPRVRQQR